MTEEERFGLHDFKRRDITDTGGSRTDKMLDVYNLSIPAGNPAAE
ncbi:hypothetical protein [Azotobacter beijerinckii]|nr:hypothetical protein [Azotobacter beijerinckii]